MEYKSSQSTIILILVGYIIIKYTFSLLSKSNSKLVDINSILLVNIIVPFFFIVLILQIAVSVVRFDEDGIFIREFHTISIDSKTIKYEDLYTCEKISKMSGFGKSRRYHPYYRFVFNDKSNYDVSMGFLRDRNCIQKLVGELNNRGIEIIENHRFVDE